MVLGCCRCCPKMLNQTLLLVTGSPIWEYAKRRATQLLSQAVPTSSKTSQWAQVRTVGTTVWGCPSRAASRPTVSIKNSKR